MRNSQTSMQKRSFSFVGPRQIQLSSGAKNTSVTLLCQVPRILQNVGVALSDIIRLNKKLLACTWVCEAPPRRQRMYGRESETNPPPAIGGGAPT
jgi:hypothetical protein